MSDHLTLWAQALDNTSPDHFDVDGRDLNANETVARQAAVSMVSNVIKNGRRIFERDGVLLTADVSHFVVEVPSVQRDHTGRTAPIVCYGIYSSKTSDSNGAFAADALYNFATRIGRTLQPEHINLVRMSLNDLKKKSMTKRLARTPWIVGLALLILTIVWWITQRVW
jgi:hypothetical protein